MSDSNVTVIDGKLMSDSNVTVIGEKFVEDKEFENKLVRRMDFRIMPILVLLYFLSFLDR